MINDRLYKVIKTHWKQMIDGAYFYRGMSLKDINFESDIDLDPTQNPHGKEI